MVPGGKLVRAQKLIAATKTCPTEPCAKKKTPFRFCRIFASKESKSHKNKKDTYLHCHSLFVLPTGKDAGGLERLPHRGCQPKNRMSTTILPDLHLTPLSSASSADSPFADCFS
jgi:hypothetical protein